MSGILEADHYRQTRRELRDEGIVRAMYEELPHHLRLNLANDTEADGFMQMSLNEYHNRGGQKSGHIGGVLQVLREYAKEEVVSLNSTIAHIEGKIETAKAELATIPANSLTLAAKETRLRARISALTETVEELHREADESPQAIVPERELSASMDRIGAPRSRESQMLFGSALWDRS